MAKHFSIKDSLRVGWRIMRDNSALVFQVVLTIFGIQVAQQIVTKVLTDTLTGDLASFVLSIAGLVVDVGAIVISLKLIRGKKAKFADIVPPWRLVLRYLCVGLLIAGMALAPLFVGAIACAALLVTGIQAAVSASSPILILVYASTSALATISIIVSTAVVLAIYLMLRYSMACFCVIDGSRIVESLRKSAKLTYGEKWHLFGFMFVALGIYVLGILALLIGLLVAVPVIMLAYAHIYTQLKSHVE